MAAFLVACGPGLRPVADPVTPLDYCGIRSLEVVSAKQAMCLARIAGLERGGRPWRVEEDTYRITGESVWEVCNTLKIPTEQKGSEGKCMLVRKSDGEILATTRWYRERIE